MNTPLPDYAERINVESRQGGARVRVLEQPNRNNNFTALVQVDSQRRGPQFVSLDFYWDDRGNSARELPKRHQTYRDTRYRDDRSRNDRDRADTNGNRDSGTRSRRDDQERSERSRKRRTSNGGVLSPNGGYSERFALQRCCKRRALDRTGGRSGSCNVSRQSRMVAAHLRTTDTGEQASFRSPLPRANVEVSVNKLRGPRRRTNRGTAVASEQLYPCP